MNEKEILKRGINKLEKEATRELVICAFLIVIVLTGLHLFARAVNPLGTFWRGVAILISVIGGGCLGFRIYLSTKKIEAECRTLWNKIQIAFSRQETTLEEILSALEEGKAAEEIAMYVGKRKKLEVEDDLALKKMEEREAEHIPRLE